MLEVNQTRKIYGGYIRRAIFGKVKRFGGKKRAGMKPAPTGCGGDDGRGEGGSNRNAVEGEERCESRRKILVNSGSKGIKITTWTTFPGHVILVWLVFCLSLTEFNRDFTVSFNFTSHLQLSSPKEDGTASLVLSGSDGFWCHAYVLCLALVLMQCLSLYPRSQTEKDN